MNPFGSRAVDEFARLLDTGQVAGADGLLVARLRSAGAGLDVLVTPRPEFRAALRTRLVAVATVQAAQAATPARTPAAARWSLARFAPRGASIAAGTLAGVVAVSGVAVAGSQSLPGDPFYGVKRTTEALQLQLADGDVEKGTQHLEFAATRLREVRGLVLGRDALADPAALPGGLALRSATTPLAGGDAERVRDTLADMDAETRKGTALLTEAYRASSRIAPLRALSRFADRQSTTLAEVLPALPPAAQDRARASLALVAEVGEQASELLDTGTCGTACDPTEAAPALPGTAPQAPAGASSGTPSGGTGGDCRCAGAPTPTPEPGAEATTGSQPGSGTGSTPRPTPSRTREPEPSRSPTPAPSSGGLPVPVPSVPVPLPSLPAPVPTATFATLAPVQPGELVETAEELLPGSVGTAPAGDPAPVPAPVPAPSPVPLPAPVATRP